VQAYSAYYENGSIIPIGNPTIPEGRRIIITVLDEAIEIPRVNIVRAVELSTHAEPGKSKRLLTSNDFAAIKLDTKGWKFDRDEANERR